MKQSEAMQIGCIFGTVATVIYAIATTTKLRRVADKLDVTVKDLAHTDSIDIPQRMVDCAIEKAVDREVTKQVQKACDTAVSLVRKDMQSQVRSTVNDEFESLKGNVSKEINKQISNLDISAIKREVIAEAKETAAEKFKHDLDDILDKHNEELENVTRIYGAIADKISTIGD